MKGNRDRCKMKYLDRNIQLQKDKKGELAKEQIEQKKTCSVTS